MLCVVFKDRTTEPCFAKNVAKLQEVIKAQHFRICSDSKVRYIHMDFFCKNLKIFNPGNQSRDTVTQSDRATLFSIRYPLLPYFSVIEDNVLSPQVPHLIIDLP